MCSYDPAKCITISSEINLGGFEETLVYGKR